MLLASVLLTFGASPPTTSLPVDTLLCMNRLSQGKDGFSGFAEVETDKAHRQVASRLTVWTPDVEVGWSGTLNATDDSGSSANLKINPWPLPKQIEFPITVEVSVDGTSVGRFSFTEASTQIVDLERHRQARRLGEDSLSVATRPGVRIPAIELQRFQGTTRLTVVTIDRHGSQSDVKAIPVPRWEHVADFARTSFTALESDRIAKACRPVFKVFAVD